VLEELPDEVRLGSGSRGKPAEASPEAKGRACWPGQRSGEAVFRLLRIDQALHIDDLIRECEGAAPSETLAALSELELYGAIKQLPGKHFVRAWA
jgi:predicted Rossmann fold nucleotide-binding protein DprA/Smf involved in DNA uptake